MAIAMSILDLIKFDEKNLVPVIAQDFRNGQVLMMAWMNRDALEKTIETCNAHYYSRSRGKLWMKGESSGHTQRVKEIYLDCDGDTILMKVEQKVAACHTGHYSCFYREVGGDDLVEVPNKVFDKEKIYGR